MEKNEKYKPQSPSVEAEFFDADLPLDAATVPAEEESIDSLPRSEASADCVDGDARETAFEDDSSPAAASAPERDEHYCLSEIEKQINEINGQISGIDGQIISIGKRINGVAQTEERLGSELRELRKLYHNEFAGRLKSMQDELDRYRNIESGRAFDGILKGIAGIYNAYESLPDSVEDPKAKKEIGYLLEDIKDLVGQYGMTASRSDLTQTPKPKRDPRRCKVAKRLPTDDPEEHETIAKSYNTAFQIGNRVVVEERVDIFFYDSKATSKETNDNDPKNESTAN